MSVQNTYQVVDLFCGAGGLSLGFCRAGFDIVQAVDKHPDAVATYRANLGDHVQELDLVHESNWVFADAEVMIGGPPCQGFSSAGMRKVNDERNSLVSMFAQVVAARRPRAFVFENVEGFLTAENGKRVFELLHPLIEAGYRIHLRKINAAHFGIAQHRKRVVAIGGLGWDPSFPMPTHSALGVPGARLTGAGLMPTLTVAQALDGLIFPSSKAPGEPQGHYYRPLTGIEMERAKALQPGQTMRDLSQALQHPSYERRANRRVMDGTPTERRGGAPSGLRRLRADEPSKAITGGAIAEFLHPVEDRSLTIRECARLQGFPDTFVFHGRQSSQAQLIGNAVPPLLAEVIATSLMQDLTQSQSTVTNGPGKLLSFVPTLSTGYSPILRKVTNEVEQLFGIALEVQGSFPWA